MNVQVRSVHVQSKAAAGGAFGGRTVTVRSSESSSPFSSVTVSRIVYVPPPAKL